MNKPASHWRDLPKTELHLHLEGAAPVGFMRELAARKGRDISGLLDGDGEGENLRYKWRDFPDFLVAYEAVTEFLSGPEDYAALTRAVLAEQASHNVVYTEIFIGVVIMAGNDQTKFSEMMAAILEASKKAEAEHGIVARYIGTIVRHFGVEAGEEAARIVAASAPGDLTGFGMAGAEDHGRPRDFARAFDIAREAGFGLTCHSGEWMGPEHIRETIEQLRPSRIGHGVRAAEDQELLALIREKDIHLEVCPGSNIALGIAPDIGAHPVHALQEAGVSLSVSTDDPPFFATNMSREYEKLAGAGWDDAMFAHCNQEAMRHAFCDEKTREKLARIFRPKG